IEAHLLDYKDIDLKLASGMRQAGESIHSMWLRVTIDKTLTIVDAEAATEAMPYPGHCHQITPTYKKIIGLAIQPGFTNRIRDLFGGTAGCTHITELIGVVATAAYQTLAGQLELDPARKPYQLDRCHALRTDSATVARFYPQWYRGTKSEN
ncbi:MAG: DUF2889 domain-containing protein, partial [Betaproteobacteria bacterium]|nr:DUF2889 domain-containing protein [Betaproteobacteria bacterium]